MNLCEQSGKILNNLENKGLDKNFNTHISTDYSFVTDNGTNQTHRIFILEGFKER
jgi:hypothetical protein